MASPTLETVCCRFSEHHPSVESQLHFDIIPYNVVCLVSGVIGIFGAIYQVLPYVERGHQRRIHFSSIRQRSFITWLAISDLMASVGIFIRSITWVADTTAMPAFSDHDHGNVFCAIISVWIHLFYCATYFWTIIYAIDVYLTTKRIPSKPALYHAFCWGLSFAFTSSSMISLYVPDMKCHMEYKSVLTNYLLTYLPIFIAMAVNPVFYVLASKEVKILLTTHSGQFSDQERFFLRALKEKFFFIVFVFYCCWLPNIVNGIILWGMWGNLPRGVLISLWYMMATLNPLQAFLNSLVYRGWEFCGKTFGNLCWPAVEEADLPANSDQIPVLDSQSSE